MQYTRYPYIYNHGNSPAGPKIYVPATNTRRHGSGDRPFRSHAPLYSTTHFFKLHGHVFVFIQVIIGTIVIWRETFYSEWEAVVLYCLLLGLIQLAMLLIMHDEQYGSQAKRMTRLEMKLQNHRRKVDANLNNLCYNKREIEDDVCSKDTRIMTTANVMKDQSEGEDWVMVSSTTPEIQLDPGISHPAHLPSESTSKPTTIKASSVVLGEALEPLLLDALLPSELHDQSFSIRFALYAVTAFTIFHGFLLFFTLFEIYRANSEGKEGDIPVIVREMWELSIFFSTQVVLYVVCAWFYLRKRKLRRERKR